MNQFSSVPNLNDLSPGLLWPHQFSSEGKISQNSFRFVEAGKTKEIDLAAVFKGSELNQKATIDQLKTLMGSHINSAILSSEVPQNQFSDFFSELICFLSHLGSSVAPPCYFPFIS